MHRSAVPMSVRVTSVHTPLAQCDVRRNSALLPLCADGHGAGGLLHKGQGALHASPPKPHCFFSYSSFALYISLLPSSFSLFLSFSLSLPIFSSLSLQAVFQSDNVTAISILQVASASCLHVWVTSVGSTAWRDVQRSASRVPVERFMRRVHRRW